MRTSFRCLPRYSLLDPLRGVAIGCVLAAHLTAPGGAISACHDFIVPMTRHGYVGVVLFFVISGYCIAGAATRARKFRVSDFLFHRLRRIFPPYWWSIVLAVVLAAGTIFVGGKPWMTIFPLDFCGWLLNLVLLQGPFAAGNIQPVYWSLTIEWQFYLMIGCLLFVPMRLEWLVAALAAGTGILRVIYSLDGTCLNHWGQFSAGMACFYWLYNVDRSRHAAVVILLSTSLSASLETWIHLRPFLWPGSLPRSLMDGFSVAVAILLIAIHGFDQQLCRQRIVTLLGWVGAISYSLYLTHNVVGVRVMNIGMRLTGLEGWWWPVFLLGALALTFVVGQIFFSYCEKPWIKFSPTSSSSSQ